MRIRQEKGGAGMLNKIIKEQSNQGNQNFVGAMRNINNNDANVRAKLREKSQGVGAYLEGGAGTEGTYAQYQGTQEYADEMNNRIKNHQVGLNQSGDDIDEYLASVSASQNARDLYQGIMEDQSFLATLDDADRTKVINAARSAGVTGTMMQQHQQQMADNLQDINDLLSQHGNGNGGGGTSQALNVGLNQVVVEDCDGERADAAFCRGDGSEVGAGANAICDIPL